ncbi:MAG: hypothetical protein EBR48_00915 [bacterium]|nr:hypothetical protein [Candidatus Aquidulcis frankliniae]
MTSGLCSICIHARLVVSGRGSRFLRCGLSDTDDRFPRYPRLPVMRCTGFSAETPPDASPPSAASTTPPDPQK